jgi:hypothetical protein
MNMLKWFVGWKLKAALGVLLVVVLVSWTGFWVNEGRKGEVNRMAPVFQSYKDRIALLLVQLDLKDAEIDRVNATVDQLKADADERAVKAAAEVRAAKTLADRYRLRASQIAAAKPTGDQCLASRDLIVSVLKEERQ